MNPRPLCLHREKEGLREIKAHPRNAAALVALLVGLAPRLLRGSFVRNDRLRKATS